VFFEKSYPEFKEQHTFTQSFLLSFAYVWEKALLSPLTTAVYPIVCFPDHRTGDCFRYRVANGIFYNRGKINVSIQSNENLLLLLFDVKQRVLAQRNLPLVDSLGMKTLISFAVIKVKSRHTFLITIYS
jgi:hypothetical protein